MSRQNPIFIRMLALLIGALLLLAFVGCKSSVPVIPGGVHLQTHDSVRTEHVHDSIYIDRWHTKWIKGDTVYIHDSIYLSKWKHDSIFVNTGDHTIDTIYQTVEMEKQYKAFLVNSGIALWVIIALIILGVVVGIIIKVAK